MKVQVWVLNKVLLTLWAEAKDESNTRNSSAVLLFLLCPSSNVLCEPKDMGANLLQLFLSHQVPELFHTSVFYAGSQRGS